MAFVLLQHCAYTIVADVKLLQLHKVSDFGRKTCNLIVTQCQLPQLLQLVKSLQNTHSVHIYTRITLFHILHETNPQCLLRTLPMELDIFYL